jgi:hypothetical protein
MSSEWAEEISHTERRHAFSFVSWEGCNLNAALMDF